MCGIAGFFGGDWSSSADVRSTLLGMAGSLTHRGPDRSDLWSDSDCDIGFAHTRLAIIDLTSAGDQPMHSHSGRYVIIYNGEIYNHMALRAELAADGSAPDWNGHSDTETLLAAIDAWGVRGALERAAGMFAFALWDRSERKLILARDRVGEKPLYYGRASDRAFLFASELKALVRYPLFDAEVDRHSLALLLRYNYVPAPRSIYAGISKIRPGTFLTITGGSDEPAEEVYWSASAVAEAGVSDPLNGGDRQVVDELERLLEQAIGQQMIADVPIGAFLSGGVDSATVVALMQKLSHRPVKTFTIGFHEHGYNEAERAKTVAAHLGTDHTELYVTAEELNSVVPRLSAIYDEPLADSSQIPTYLVSALARQQVSVALSGDGGDELFGGYNRYLLTSKLWAKISAVPMPLRRVAARGLTAVSPAEWTRFGDALGGLLPQWAQFERLGDMIRKGAPVLDSASAVDLHDRMISNWRDLECVVTGTDSDHQVPGGAADVSNLGAIERMMALDMLGYLPDDLLVKVDRAAMAVSLETRIPYLDPKIIDFAWRIPMDLKIRGGTTKWILRQLLDRYVPSKMFERPKMGFAVPLDDWLRGPLRDWAEELLDERRLREAGYFRPEPIRDAWKLHLSGRSDEQVRLWPVLMFQSWLQAYGGASRKLEFAPGAA